MKSGTALIITLAVFSVINRFFLTEIYSLYEVATSDLMKLDRFSWALPDIWASFNLNILILCFIDTVMVGVLYRLIGDVRR